MKREDLKNWTREQLEIEVLNLNSKIWHMQFRENNAEENIGRFECTVSSLKEEIDSLQKELDKCYKEIKDRENSHMKLYNDTKEEIRRLEDENKALKHRIEELEKETLPFSDDIDYDELISELEERHQQDCITINQLNVTIDTLILEKIL